MDRDLLVDVDEVLADFQTPILELMSQMMGRTVLREDFEVWDIFSVIEEQHRKSLFAALSQPGFALTFEPTKGAQDFIKALSNMGRVYIVTSPFPSATWASDRVQWVKEHFDIPANRVITTSAKYKVHGRLLLDDNPNHVTDWAKRFPTELDLLWHIPNTRTFEHPNRVYTWDEVLTRVDQHLSK